jgi:hypothetical protein
MEYGGCSVRKRASPRRSETHWASMISAGGRLEWPIARTLPGQGGEGFLDVGAGVGVVDLVEVDVVDAEAPQRSLDRGDNPAAGVAALVGVGAHGAVELGGEHDVVAPAAQRLAHDPFGFAIAAVDVGGIDEVDARVEGPVNDLDAVVGVGVAERAEHHGTQAIGGDLDAGAAQGARAHEGSSRGGRAW